MREGPHHHCAISGCWRLLVLRCNALFPNSSVWDSLLPGIPPPPSPRVHRFNASKHSISSGDYNEFLYIMGFPGSSDGKESACNAGDTGNVGSIPGLGRSPGKEDGYPL